MTYNGWSNYETWNVKLWMDNDQGSYEYWGEVARETWDNSDSDAESYWTQSDRARHNLADRLRDYHGDQNPLIDQAGTYSDLLGAALSEVDWQEIAESLLEDNVDQYEPRTEQA